MTMMAIMLCPHDILHVQKPVFDVGEERVTVPHLLVHGRQFGEAWLVGQQGWRGTAVDHLERSRLERRLKRRVVAEFGQR